jgi:hypothetical protein
MVPQQRLDGVAQAIMPILFNSQANVGEFLVGQQHSRLTTGLGNSEEWQTIAMLRRSTAR